MATLATRSASAQVTGSIAGNVYDQTGQPLRGIKIVTDSPTQIGGARTTYTNDEGSFRFMNLQPGTFRIVASAPHMATVEQRGIVVGVSNAASIDLVMEVQADIEEVKIIEKAPLVNTKNATVKETFDEDFLDNLPLESRDSYLSVLQNNVPGSAYTGDGNIRINGGENTSNTFMMDGFRINSHGVQGVQPQLATMKSMAAMEVQTAGYGAEYSTSPGSVLNLVTKSGSNKFEIDALTYHENSALTFNKDGTDSNGQSSNTKVSLSFSGPIIRDRVWFFSTTEVGYQESRREKDPFGLRPQIDPYLKLDLRQTLKLTWQINARNKLQTIQKVDYSKIKNSNGDYSTDNEANLQNQDQNSLHTLRWEALLGDHLFFRSGIAYNRFMRHWLPQSCDADPVNCLHTQPYVQQIPYGYFNFGNYTEGRQLKGQDVEVTNELEWFIDSRKAGEHDIKLVGRYYREYFEEARMTPGGGIIYLNGADPDREVFWYSNDPRIDGVGRDGWNVQNGASAQIDVALYDAYRPTKYTTLTLGGSFVNASAENEFGNRVIDFYEPLPNVSVVWDATHDGRTAIRASVAERMQVASADLARFALGSRANQSCKWDPSSGGFTNCGPIGGDNGGNKSIGSPCGPTGVWPDGTSCRHSL